MKYAWAAYKKNALPEHFGLGAFKDPDMDQAQFRDLFTRYVEQVYNGAWTLFAETPKGRHAAGMVFGWPLPANMLIMGEVVWFPWATKRNILTSAVSFINAQRDDEIVMVFGKQKDVPFLDRLAAYGLMRRVGNVHDLFAEPATLYQSSTPQHMRVY